jgi:hypothetical protein
MHLVANSDFAQRGVCVSKSHQIAWDFALILIHSMPKNFTEKIKGRLISIKLIS